jgi:hypothetical protein
MSARTVLTIVVSALVCLALMGRPALRGGADGRVPPDAQSTQAAGDVPPAAATQSAAPSAAITAAPRAVR